MHCVNLEPVKLCNMSLCTFSANLNYLTGSGHFAYLHRPDGLLSLGHVRRSPGLTWVCNTL